MAGHGRTALKVPMRGKTRGSGMKHGKRSMLPKHRTRNRTGGR